MKGLAAGNEKTQDVDLLLARRVRHSHHAFREKIAALTLRAEGFLAPHHKLSQLALGVVIRGLDVIAVHEGPQCLLMFKNVGARARDVSDICCDGAPEASLRQPCERFNCVFRDTPLDSDGTPSLKLSPSGAAPFSQRVMERSAIA